MGKLKTIGVLGGMGPAATAAFQQRVIDLTDAGDDADHVPLLVDMNPQVPSRIKAIMSLQDRSFNFEGPKDISNSPFDTADYFSEQNLDDNENPGPVLARMARGLKASGAEAIVMPCNTAHFYAEYIERAVDIPFLNMVTLSAVHLRQAIGPSKIGMLASPLTDDIGIFRDAFSSFDMDVVFPKNADFVLNLIRTIKSEGISDEMDWPFRELALELQKKGADCLLIGCSEFSLLRNRLSPDLPLFDTVDILASETIRFSRGI